MRRAVLALALISSTAIAKAPPGGFTADLSVGVQLPAADNDYVRTTDPGFQFGLRAGWDFHLTKMVGIGPELGFDAAAVTADTSTFQNVPSRFARVKGLFGARFVLHFPIGFFFVRALFGVDHSEGYFEGVVFGVTLRSNWATTGFAFVPETGVMFRVWRMLHVGFTLGFPVATNKYTTNVQGLDKSFNSLDVTLQATVGVHL